MQRSRIVQILNVSQRILGPSLAAALPAERRVLARRGWEGEKDELFERPVGSCLLFQAGEVLDFRQASLFSILLTCSGLAAGRLNLLASTSNQVLFHFLGPRASPSR